MGPITGTSFYYCTCAHCHIVRTNVCVHVKGLWDTRAQYSTIRVYYCEDNRNRFPILVVAVGGIITNKLLTVGRYFIAPNRGVIYSKLELSRLKISLAVIFQSSYQLLW